MRESVSSTLDWSGGLVLLIPIALVLVAILVYILMRQFGRSYDIHSQPLAARPDDETETLAKATKSPARPGDPRSDDETVARAIESPTRPAETPHHSQQTNLGLDSYRNAPDEHED